MGEWRSGPQTGSAQDVQSSAPALACWNVVVAWLARSIGMNCQYSGILPLYWARDAAVFGGSTAQP
jgi:hypothetical protein